MKTENGRDKWWKLAWYMWGTAQFFLVFPVAFADLSAGLISFKTWLAISIISYLCSAGCFIFWIIKKTEEQLAQAGPKWLRDIEPSRPDRIE